MGEYLEKNGGPKCADSIIYECYKRDIPIFCPAFNDCSAGFGLVAHAVAKGYDNARTATWDGGKDFYELTQLKIKNPTTGIFMLGGGVPKKLHAGHRRLRRGAGSRCPDAQVRRAGHRRRCA